MKADTLKMSAVFNKPVSYQVPLFQRPYVWTAENWGPLWDDVQGLIDKRLKDEKTYAHFLGAAVMEQLPNSTGAVETRQVIDGQQRFTTLQVFLCVARDQSMAAGSTHHKDCFEWLVVNPPPMIRLPHEAYKVWPTNSDRAAFMAIHKAGSLAALNKEIDHSEELSRTGLNLLLAYKFFAKKFEAWLAGGLDDADDIARLATKTAAERLEAVWQVVNNDLQLVVIDLGKDDESQVIFETLNARGTALLPADLIKNYLFRRAPEDQAESLYNRFWKPFEDAWWRQETTQGRFTRQNLDIFVQHYLTMMTAEDIKSSHVFGAFKEFAEEGKERDGSRISFPKTPAQHLERIAIYGKVFRSFDLDQIPDTDRSRLAVFLRRIEALDTTTIFPFLMYACVELQDDRKELEAIVGIIESFLVRRMVFLPENTRGYNRIFVDLIKATKNSPLTADSVARQMLRATGDSGMFPSDDNVREALGWNMYRRIKRDRVSMLLEALDEKAYNSKSEYMPPPSKLTIEHVLPQSWLEHWPIPADIAADPVRKIEFVETRDRALHTLGNLTLITKRLNPAVGNLDWDTKRQELGNYSRLNLTRYFLNPKIHVWDEAAIATRSAILTDQFLEIWPMPQVDAVSDPAAS